MPAILAGIVAFFRFFKWSNLVDWVLKGLTFGKMVGVNIAIITATGLYCWAVFNIIKFVYQKGNQFINLINDMTSGASNDILGWAMDIIKALGVWNAFVDVYNVYSVPLVSLITIYAYKLVLKFLHSYQLTLVSLNISRI